MRGFIEIQDRETGRTVFRDAYYCFELSLAAGTVRHRVSRECWLLDRVALVFA